MAKHLTTSPELEITRKTMGIVRDLFVMVRNGLLPTPREWEKFEEFAVFCGADAGTLKAMARSGHFVRCDDGSLELVGAI